MWCIIKKSTQLHKEKTMQTQTTAQNFVEGAIFTYFNSMQKWSKPMVIIGIDEKDNSFSCMPLEKIITADRLSEIFDKGNKPLKYDFTEDNKNVFLSDKGFIIQSTADIENFDAVGANPKKKNNFISIADFKRNIDGHYENCEGSPTENLFDRFVRLNSFSSYQFHGSIQFFICLVDVNSRFSQQMPLFFTPDENPEWDRYEKQYRETHEIKE